TLQNERPQLIRDETIIAQQALEDLQKKLKLHASSTSSKLENQVRQLELTTLFDARTAELKMLTAEADSNLVRIDKLKAELQLQTIQRDILSPSIDTIETLLNDRRQQEAANMENELTEAEKKVSGKHGLIQQATRENIQYSRDFQVISGKIEQYNERKNKAEAAAKAIENDFKSAEKKINLAGLSPVLGKILREQRRNLASPDQIKQESDTIQDETALSSLDQFRVDDKLKDLSDMEGYIKGQVEQQIDPKLPSSERMMIQAELRVLLNSQKDVLNKLSAAETTYLRTLGDLDFANQQLLAQSAKYADYLDERLLWVRSSAPINTDFLHGLFDSVRWFLSPNNWLSLIKDTITIALENPFLTFILVAISLWLPFVRNWAKRQLQIIAEKIEKIYTDNFSYTLKAFACTIILVLPLPLLLYIWGWFLTGDTHSTDFNKAIGEGLASAAMPLFGLELLHRILRPDGMAVRHFQWQKETARLFQRQVAWLRFVIVPGIFLIYMTGASALASNSDNLGRLALLINMGALVVIIARLLHPSAGLFGAYFKARPDSWFSTMRYIWYPLLVSIPLIIAGFAVTGYYLSALELQQKLVITIRLVFVNVIVYGMAIRWLTFVNRKLALKNAKQKRKAAGQSEKQQANSDGLGMGDEPIIHTEEQLIDIPTINAQTIQLVKVTIGFSLVVGLWMIWSNILPAFSFLENIVLWQHQAMVDNQEITQPVTMKNLILAGLYVFLVVVAVRNFSAVMELLIFSRITVATGGRYAVNQLANYLIITIGFLCIANELGGNWSQVQWLVAALGVGLGFGLQEIFANLVSGIIILFERPIRVGDTVTIGDVTGKISRIQMRATTIVDWDQKELIVPNKTFITSQLTNWSLTDAITRIVIPIGIAYGSDIEHAHKVMMEAVKLTPMVLEDPPPGVVFNGFGDSALNFSIRVFVGEIANRLPVTHNLHINLEKALRENKIQIPFPQREVRVVSETIEKPERDEQDKTKDDQNNSVHAVSNP
ncbi:partial Miniconductance mechanosensitive channel MscM, partial [biofilm metagenome]